MQIDLSKEQKKEILLSIQRFFDQELEFELGELRAGLLLDYFLKEIGPFAYNRGVEDARRFIASKTEDLSGTCFEHGLTYWSQQDTSKAVRRGPTD